MVPAQGFSHFQVVAAAVAVLSDNARHLTYVTSAQADIFQFAVGQLRQGRACAADVIPSAYSFDQMNESGAQAAVMRPGCVDSSHNKFPFAALNVGERCLTLR